MTRITALAIIALAACAGDGTAVEALQPNTCLDAVGLRFCADFDRIDQQVAPFGFGEFLGGEMTILVMHRLPPCLPRSDA